MDIALEDEEFQQHFDQLLELKKVGFPSKTEAAEHAYILCDNLYRRVKNADKQTRRFKKTAESKD
jgi:hypothetical protein